jgi:hypothetical protein
LSSIPLAAPQATSQHAEVGDELAADPHNSFYRLGIALSSAATTK